MRKLLLMSTMAILLLSLPIKAEEHTKIPDGFEVIRCTCYLPTGNNTADGTVPFEGICASNREHLGQIAILYSMDGEFIGYYQSRDTGNAERLKNGTSIDIFRKDMDGAKEWAEKYGDYVYIKWVKGEG